MTTPCFPDTNILVYATSLAADHGAKRDAARSWVACADWGQMLHHCHGLDYEGVNVLNPFAEAA